MDAVREALAAPLDEFRSTLVSSLEEVRGMLGDVGRTDEERAGELAVELGPFAVGRIDTGALTAVLSEKQVLAPDAEAVIRRASEALGEMASAEGGLLFDAKVPPDGDLRDTVRDALHDAGRFFGVARAAAHARTGGWQPEKHEALFEGLPFRAWTTRERAVAPPLVVRVQGADLRPSGLADFLDGALKLVLVVEGEAPPAALARLITPGVMVVQATTPDGLAPLADFPGSGIAGVFGGASTLDAAGGGIVPFVHDPRKGALPAERIAVATDLEALGAVLGDKKWKRGWKEDLQHLLTLATLRAGAAPSEDGAGAAEAAVDEVTGADRLAAWLLARTDLDEA
jgi:hypothetical protein